MIGLSLLLFWSVSFVFSGIEAGLLSIDPVRLRHKVKQGDAAATKLDRLLQQPERLLVTVLLVTNFADILAILVLTNLLVRAAGNAGYPIAFAIALPIHLFLLGVLPRSLFRRFPYRAVAALAGLLEFVSKLLWPLLELGKIAGRLILPRSRESRPRIFAAREELKRITARSEREGAITPGERALIHNVVDFRGVSVKDVMIPLPKITFIDPEASVQEALTISIEKGFGRLPVISRGQASGLINILDILLDEAAPRPLKTYMRRIVTTQLDEPAYRLIRRLRAARLSLAAVQDASGALAGIVTAEDLVRRLVASR